MLRILRNCIHLVEPNRRWAWAFLALLALLASGIEVVSALLVVVLLSTVSTTGPHIDVPVLGPIDERFPNATHGELILGVCVVVAVFFLARGVFTILQAYFQGRIAANAGVALASKLLRGYLAMDYTVHLKRNSAEMIRNVGQSVDIISQQLFVAYIALGSDLLTVFALGAVVVAAAPLPSLMAGATLGLITLVIIRGLNPRFAALGQTNQELTAATWQTIQHSLDGIRDLKVLGVGPFFSERYARQRAQLARVRYLLNAFGTVPRVALETVLVMFIVGLVAFFQLTGTSNEDALAVLGLFGFTAFRTLPAVTRIITQVNMIRYAGAAVDHVIADLDIVGLGRVPLQRAASTGQPVNFRHELAIDHVTYRYPDTEVDVIRDVNLLVRRGQSVGIVGSTGAGKSTLIDMVLGLLRPASGRVLVDGVDIATSTGQWQRLLGVVSQTVYLTDDSLEANIAFGVDPDDVDHPRALAAASVAQLDGLLERLPAGLGTMVGERGVRLSGGERQRVAIARALYNEPEVLVFDEGTSALDNATEAQLIEAVERLRGSKTIITVAHRLTTVRKCDWIAVLQRGEVVGLGTFDELVANSDAFRDLAALSGPL